MRSRLELKGRLAAHILALAMLVVVLAYARPVPPDTRPPATANAGRISEASSVLIPLEPDKMSGDYGRGGSDVFPRAQHDTDAGISGKPADGNASTASTSRAVGSSPSEPARTEPANVGQTNVEPSTSEPEKVEPGQSDSAKIEPAKVEPEAGKPDSGEPIDTTSTEKAVADAGASSKTGGSEPPITSISTNGGGAKSQAVEPEMQAPTSEMIPSSTSEAVPDANPTEEPEAGTAPLTDAAVNVRPPEVDAKQEQSVVPEAGVTIDKPASEPSDAAQGGKVSVVSPPPVERTVPDDNTVAPSAGTMPTAPVDSPTADTAADTKETSAPPVGSKDGEDAAAANGSTAANALQPDESGAIVVADPGSTAVETPLSKIGDAELLGEKVYWLNPVGGLETALKSLPDIKTVLFLVAQPGESPSIPAGIKKMSIAVGGDSLDIGMAVDFLTATSSAGNLPLLVAVEHGAGNAAFLKGAYLLVNRKPQNLENALRDIGSDMPADAARKARIRHRLTRLDVDDLRLRAGL